ncbi:MAG: type II secretion system GspH family protein [Lentisphaerales bacterium]|nr:type II secretion system GspH family protein [Lentisphaerales bacterium]
MKTFTLIELLMVIAIIGILTSFLLPSLSKARQVSLASVCVSNMKQINLGITLFADENDEFLPGRIWNSVYTYYDDSNHLQGQIAPYLDYPAVDPSVDHYIQVFDCPSFTVCSDGSGKSNARLYTIFGKDQTGKYYFGSHNRGTDASKISIVESPSEENSLFERDVLYGGNKHQNQSALPRHGIKGGNYQRSGLWWDGHAKLTTKRAKH